MASLHARLQKWTCMAGILLHRHCCVAKVQMVLLFLFNC
jgi:hypothetical protein